MVPHPLFFRTHVYGIRLFPPIFRLKWYPILVINSQAWNPFAVFPPTCLHFLPIFCPYSTHFPPIFRLTFSPYSAGPVLPGIVQIFKAAPPLPSVQTVQTVHHHWPVLDLWLHRPPVLVGNLQLVVGQIDPVHLDAIPITYIHITLHTYILHYKHTYYITHIHTYCITYIHTTLHIFIFEIKYIHITLHTFIYEIK